MIGSSLSPLSTSTFHYFLWPFSTDVQKKKPFMLWESNHLPYVCLYIFERNPYLHFQLACFNSGLLLLYTSCWVLVGSAHPRNILEPRKSGWQYLIGQYFPSKPPNELPSKILSWIMWRDLFTLLKDLFAAISEVLKDLVSSAALPEKQP